MSGLARYSSILRLFTPEDPSWTVPQMSAALGTPTSTVYRTVRELAGEGFLEASVDAHYRLGSAFVEFDRMMRLTDPLVRTGAPLLRDLVHEVRLPCTCVLARLYGDRVISTADERTPGAKIPTSYERGRPMPLIRGATSKAILANLPTRRLKNLLQSEGAADASEEAVSALKKELLSIRKRGYSVTRGEVDPSLIGIAAPIANRDLAISASISVILEASSSTPSAEQRLILLVVSSAKMIVDELEALAAQSMDSKALSAA